MANEPWQDLLAYYIQQHMVRADDPEWDWDELTRYPDLVPSKLIEAMTTPSPYPVGHVRPTPPLIPLLVHRYEALLFLVLLELNMRVCETQEAYEETLHLAFKSSKRTKRNVTYFFRGEYRNPATAREADTPLAERLDLLSLEVSRNIEVVADLSLRLRYCEHNQFYQIANRVLFILLSEPEFYEPLIVRQPYYRIVSLENFTKYKSSRRYALKVLLRLNIALRTNISKRGGLAALAEGTALVDASVGERPILPV